MSLQIRKKSTSAWEHIKDGQNIILSNGSFRIQNNSFELTEISGVDQFDQPQTALANITLYDDTSGGVAETFSNTTDFVDRLRQLDYPFFSTASGGSGAVKQIVAGTNITLDPVDGLGIVQINASGGSASFDVDINQVAHGLSVGDIIQYNSGYTTANAATAENADAIGIVTAVADADNFTYTYGGLIATSLGLTNGDSGFLQNDGSVASTPGTINVFLGTQTPDGFLIEIGQGFSGGGGASQLSDLSDVNTSTPTNRNVLIADGVDWESRALTEADISDLQDYATYNIAALTNRVAIFGNDNGLLFGNAGFTYSSGILNLGADDNLAGKLYVYAGLGGSGSEFRMYVSEGTDDTVNFYQHATSNGDYFLRQFLSAGGSNDVLLVTDTDQVLEAPNNSVANIDAASNNTVLTTKEWVEQYVANNPPSEGTASYSTLTGVVNIDVTALSDDTYYLLTGNTTITWTNTPAVGKSFVRSFIIKSTSAETLTLPAADISKGTFANDGSENQITVKFSNFATEGLKIVQFINPA